MLCIPPPVPIASGKSSGKSRMMNKRPQKRSHGGFRFRFEKRERMGASPGREKEGLSHNPRKPGGVPCRYDSTPIAIYHLPHSDSLISFRRFFPLETSLVWPFPLIAPIIPHPFHFISCASGASTFPIYDLEPFRQDQVMGRWGGIIKKKRAHTCKGKWQCELYPIVSIRRRRVYC